MSRSTTPQVAAVIADLVGSRDLQDRAGAHRQVLTAWSTAHEQVVGVGDAAAARAVSPWATVGDEFQAVYPDLASALRALLRLLLDLQDPVRLRFGIGLGTVTTLEQGADGPIQDGDAWWSARAAIDAGRERDRRGAVLEVRRAEEEGDGAPEAPVAPAARLESVSARLLEHVVGEMKPRERRILRATLDGVLQQQIAEAEGISQSAVSQSLTRSGGRALVDVDRLLAGSDAAEERS